MLKAKLQPVSTSKNQKQKIHSPSILSIIIKINESLTMIFGNDSIDAEITNFKPWP